MVVSDDQVEAKPARSLRFSKGPHAGIHSYHQPDTLGMCRFKHARLQTVAFAQSVRNMKARLTAEHLDCRLQQHHRRRPVYVVIAVEQHRLVICNRALEPFNSRRHPQHQERIVELTSIRIQKRVRLRGLGNAA